MIIELAPDFAPVHVANMRRFARAGWWNGADHLPGAGQLCRAMGQWRCRGARCPTGVVAQPPAEYERGLAGPRHPPARLSRQLRADGRPCRTAGRSATIPSGAWPGSPIAMPASASAATSRPDTGTGGELYAVIGHAPRPLDLNIANVGRVVEGIALLSARPRGTRQSRLLQGRSRRDPDPDRPRPPRRRHARGRAARASR